MRQCQWHNCLGREIVAHSGAPYSMMLLSTTRGDVKAFLRKTVRIACSSRGSQLVEFAVSLPFLALMVVGIMDFGSAVTLKHKLDIAVEQAARVASNQTYADISNPLPKSTEAIRSALVSDLTAMKVNECGLSTATPAKAALTWTYNASGCPGTLTLVIDRGNLYQNAGHTPEWIEANH